MSRRFSRSIALAFAFFLAIAVLSLAIALIALAASGGGDSTNVTAPPPPGISATRTEEPEASNSADVLSQLQALGDGVKQAKGKITYTETGTSGSSASITYYSNPPNTR